MFRVRTAATAALLIALPRFILAAPAIFPDVPTGHRFQTEIESLVRLGVVHGNPDGKFSPDRTVNRAEMLKMLYVAEKIMPETGSARCFLDVTPDSWYEPYVCDAVKKNFVRGYGDGTFRPQQAVTRVEALKMLFSVLDIPAPTVTSRDRDTVKFVDISTSAWYTQYVYASYNTGLLPVAGQDSSHFKPDEQLTRGEAAAYIARALSLDLGKTQASSSSGRSSSSSSSSSAPAEPPVKSVTAAFKDTGRFMEKKVQRYLFTLSGKKTLLINADITGAIESDITCRLYLLRDDGFVEQYFLGMQLDGKCAIKAALSAGKYQLEIQPTTKDAYYSITSAETTGDGNDGFTESRVLPKGAHTDILGANDYADFFTFNFAKDMTGTIDIASSSDLDCVIFTPLSIDQFGFSGPSCGESFDFKEGTYTVVVSRTEEPARSLSYTIQLR